MKKILLILVFIGTVIISKAQTNPFPSTDSLERFINRHIRNSPVESFQNLRMNTSLIGMLRFIQNSEVGSGLDTAYALNDSTLRLVKFGETLDILIRGNGGVANANAGAGFRILKPGPQELKTLFPRWGELIDTSSNTDGLTIGPDTTLLSTRAWRQKGDDSVAAVLRQVITDTAANIRADFPSGFDPSTDSLLTATRRGVIGFESYKVPVYHQQGLIQIGNSISLNNPSYFPNLLVNAMGDKSVYLNYSIAGSPSTNVGDIWRDGQIPIDRKELAAYNNGINDIRNFMSDGTLSLTLHCIREFLIACFGQGYVNASAATQTAGTWLSYSGLTNTAVSRSDCMYAIDSGATLTFAVPQFSPGVFVSFITQDEDSVADWSDSVTIKDNFGNLLASVNPNKKSVYATGPFAVTIPTFITSANAVVVTNHRNARVVVDFAGYFKERFISAPALIAEITKVADAALQPGIPHSWWDTVNAAITNMVHEEWTRFGFPVTTFHANDGLLNNSATHMTELPSDPPNAIHPNATAHRDVLFPRLMEKIQWINFDQDVVINVPNTAAYTTPSTALNQFSKNRTFIMPTPSQNSTIQITTHTKYYSEGQTLRFINTNNSAFTWSALNWSWRDNYGAVQTVFRNNTVVEMVWDSTIAGFRQTNMYGSDSLWHTTDTIRARINGKDFAVVDNTGGGGGGTPAGANTNVQYNASGSFGAEAAFSYNPDSNKVYVDSAQGRRLRYDEIWPAIGTSLTLRSPISNAVSLLFRNITPTTLLSLGTDASANAFITANGALAISASSASSISMTHNVGVADSRTGMTASGRALSATSTATYNTTSGALQSEGGRFINRSQRTSGSNALTNYGVYSIAGAAQENIALAGEVEGTGTNTATDALSLIHSTTGVTAAGFGVRMRFRNENASGSLVTTSDIASVGTTTTAGSESFDMIFRNIASGSIAEKFRITSAGLGRFSGGLELGSLTNGVGGTDSVLVINNTVVKKVAASSFGGGITSINSETGPAITLTGANGLTRTTTTNNVEYKLGGTLGETTNIAGASNVLNIGTSGSKLGATNMFASSIGLLSDAGLYLQGLVTYLAQGHSADANLTVPANLGILELNSGSLTADRTITLPSPTLHGQTITVAVRSTTSSFHYVLASAARDIKTGTTFTQLDYGTTYYFIVNTSLEWMCILKY